MRVGLDARLNAYRGGGIPTYTRQLLAAMAALAADEAPAVQLVALEHRKQREPLVGAAAPGMARVERARLWTPPHHRLEPWTLPLEMLPRRLDLLHAPDFIAPQNRPCPAVVTIHDLAFLHYPYLLDEGGHRYYGQVHAAAWHADAVIAVSEATRRDITERLGLPAERVDLVYEAADPFFRPLNLRDPQQVAQPTTHVIGGEALAVDSFALAVGTLEPRKNLATLMQALAICRERRPGVAYRLIVVGERGWLVEYVFEPAHELMLGSSLIFTGTVSHEELRWLYNACRFYLNSSLYEGFGLPPLEAMACGAPVVVSDAGSLPEVVGDAALLLPALDEVAWADTFERLWHAADERAELAHRGPARAARFSWERAARETLAIYRRVVASSSRTGRRSH